MMERLQISHSTPKTHRLSKSMFIGHKTSMQHTCTSYRNGSRKRSTRSLCHSRRQDRLNKKMTRVYSRFTYRLRYSHSTYRRYTGMIWMCLKMNLGHLRLQISSCRGRLYCLIINSSLMPTIVN